MARLLELEKAGRNPNAGRYLSLLGLRDLYATIPHSQRLRNSISTYLHLLGSLTLLLTLCCIACRKQNVYECA